MARNAASRSWPRPLAGRCRLRLSGGGVRQSCAFGSSAEPLPPARAKAARLPPGLAEVGARIPLFNSANYGKGLRACATGRILAQRFHLAPRENFHVYSVKIDGVQCYRAAYGLYPDLAQTLTVRQLPARFWFTGWLPDGRTHAQSEPTVTRSGQVKSTCCANLACHKNR